MSKRQLILFNTDKTSDLIKRENSTCPFDYFSPMKICFLLLLTGVLGVGSLWSQQWPSSKIYHEIQKLNVLGKVLYLAAHPDDENTRFIAYCANQKQYETAYMSLTRGDGGQNLIGP